MPHNPLAGVFGFFGKIPSRGDFVRARLSRPFVQAWDGWLQKAMPEAERQLGDRWNAAWQVAPVWRFAMPAGKCGPAAVMGLWLPSVDRAGRRFPLLIAAEMTDAITMFRDASCLDAAEQAGREAIAQDLAPDGLLARLDAIAAPVPAREAMLPATMARWWSEGGPLVPAGGLELPGLPSAKDFSRMLKR